MKTQNSIKYISLFALGVFVAGCSKYLDQAPDMRTQLTSPDKVAELLVTAYPQADHITFTESASDNAEDKGEGVGNTDVTYVNPYHWEDVLDNNEGSVNGYWAACYAAIAASNQALASIAEHPGENAYQPYKGEALVARAYAHFMLVNIYAKVYTPGGDNSSPGIPYMQAPEKVVNGQYSRGTVASVYEQIEKDLEEGLPLLRNSAYKIVKYHFNVAAAHAFAARFYLFKGDYNKVIEHASAAFPGGFAPSLRPWNSRYAAMTLDEFPIYFTQASENSNLLIAEASSVWARTRTPRFGFGQKINNALFASANVTGGGWAYKVLYYTVPNYTFAKFNEHFVRASANANIGDAYVMIPLFTADELLLNRAEAYVETGQNDLALADLNTFISTRVTSYNPASHNITLAKIATFYGIADPKEGLIKTILELKRTEFMQEGIRWFDIIRRHLPVRHNLIDLVGRETFIELPDNDPRRVFQIPQTAVKSGVELNPR